ncbi:MAG: VCBS repeat-containing protein [Verrucomicrobiaceae bacterium]|nr:VCBS repeat-containing protein [Verrucomicrobiaceae bacterium]
MKPTLLLCIAGLGLSTGFAQPVLHSFDRVQLTDIYYSEGANVADFNNDGVIDAVYGPFWFAGPDFKTKHLIYKAFPQPREAYANHFFAWPFDFDGDGWVDVLTAGFPGTPAYVYRNPGKEERPDGWMKHQVFDWVSNESPHFINLVGDDKPELVCTRDGFFGYVEINKLEKWAFHTISERIAPDRFGHGLGVGDINGDGRMDVIMQNGWFEQPADLKQPLWTLHKVSFAPRGGAEMYAYDVDGDGDNDVITSLAAHEYGLSWFEQTPKGFTEHLIMGERPGQSHYNIAFSELHSVALADMDGDGLKDIVTGKTYWSHHEKSPGWNDGAVVYWFKLVRSPKGVDWVPMKADGETGIGRQLVVKDVNGDGLPDIVVGGMKGGNVLLHRTKTVTDAEYAAAIPARHDTVEPPTPRETAQPPLVVAGAIEGEAITPRVTKGTTSKQNMGAFRADRWSGNAQLFWRGGDIGDTLEFDVPFLNVGDYELEISLTTAPDYPIVQVLLDSQPLGNPIDLFDASKVAKTKLPPFKVGALVSGVHRIGLRIDGVNPKAKPSKFVGLDYVKLVKK